MMQTTSAIPFSGQAETPWVLPHRGIVGMACLIMAESAIFLIFVVAYVYYIGRSLSGPTPAEVLELPIVGTICLLSTVLAICQAAVSALVVEGGRMFAATGRLSTARRIAEHVAGVVIGPIGAMLALHSLGYSGLVCAAIALLFVFLVMRFPLITSAEQFVKLSRSNKNITWEDYEYVRDNMRYAEAVGLETRRNGKVKYKTESIEDINIRGVTANRSRAT